MGLCLLWTHGPVVLIFTCVSEFVDVSNPSQIINGDGNRLTAGSTEPMIPSLI